MVRRAVLTEAEKLHIRQRKLAGSTLRAIARELGCALATVRKWWRVGRDGRLLGRRGRPAAGVLSQFAPEIAAWAVALKRSHPHWGPANVKLELQAQGGADCPALPSDARLAVLFKLRCPEAVQPRGHTYYGEHPLAPAHFPHQRWLVDAQEKIRLTSGELVTLLNGRDEYSGLLVASRAFVTTTAKGWRKLSLAEVQSALRPAFEEWGRPWVLQTDHEVVFTGSPGADFPARFSLWLDGLGIEHATGRSRMPTDQAEIERTHRTIGDLAWKDESSARLAQLQALLDQRRQRYNQHYPSRAGHCGGQPPLVAFPQARCSGRPFRCDVEWELFSLARVEQTLAARVWSRQVSDSGGVSLGNHLYHVGTAQRGQQVSVTFCAQTHTFCFARSDGSRLAERPAKGLSTEDLIGYPPPHGALTQPFQLPLPLEGV